MKGKAIIPLVIGLCIGLFAVKFLLNAIQEAKGAHKERKTFQVVRAKLDIDSYEPITAEAVELIETADNSLAPELDRVSSLEEVIGRVTAKSIPQFAPVLKTMLAPEGTPAGMVGRIPPGFRAVSVKIDEVTGVAYQIKPGDWVDVIVVMDVDTTSGQRNKETVAEVILQHVKVAAIGRAMQTRQGTAGSKVKPAKSATLLVPEEEVPKLHLVATRGKITLSMRGADDTINEDPPVAYGGEVFGADRRRAGTENKPKRDRRSALDAMAGAFKNDTTPAVEPEVPFGVMVVHGSTTDDPTRIEQFTFENERSRSILALSEGPVNRGMALVGKRTRTPGASRHSRSLLDKNGSSSKGAFDRPNDKEDD